MSRLAENLIDIFNVIANDNEILRLIYYPSDPLNPNKPEIKDLPNFDEIIVDRIIRAPKTNDIQNEENKNICRICMYFGNGVNTRNERVDDQDVIFDVYTHIDTYEINEPRSLKIIDRINKLITLKNITGIGKTRSYRRYIVGNPPNGFLGYKVTFTFGSGKE
ncbi:hypothetical protein CHH83_02660 [Bacillus sp. 7586-K]|nr:hypothetical protein CHH83_02660 [Bacillus sp. 7586-K]